MNQAPFCEGCSYFAETGLYRRVITNVEATKFLLNLKNLTEQAGAELGQAQPKLGLSLKFKFDAEVWSRSLKLKFEVNF